MPSTQVYLFGSLRERLENKKGLSIQLDLKTPTPLIEVLEILEIPSDAGDRLSLFPKEYPVFVDWNDLRF